MTNARVRAAARTFGFAGQVAPVALTYGTVWLIGELDESEHVSRVERGLGAITDRSVVNALWQLPPSGVLGYEAIPQWVANRLSTSPLAIAKSARGIQRAVRRPVYVTGALVVGQHLRSAMKAVGEMSAVAPMGIVLDSVGPLAEDDPDLLDAKLYGMGVAAEVGGEIQVAFLPDLLDDTPVEPFAWWVAELAYAGLSLTSSEPRL